GNAIFEAFRNFIDVVSPAVDAICRNVEIQPPNRQLIYRCIIRRTQENLQMISFTAESDYAYMGTMPLRPLCEDLIYGAWLRTLPKADADQLILLCTTDDILSSMDAQDRFLPEAYTKFGQAPDGTPPEVRLPSVTRFGGSGNQTASERRAPIKREL